MDKRWNVAYSLREMRYLVKAARAVLTVLLLAATTGSSTREMRVAALAQSSADVAQEVIFDETDKLDARLGSSISWYVTFATTPMVIAYSPSSPLASRFANVARHAAQWPALLSRHGVRLVRADPSGNDAEGYRALLVAKLAEAYYHRPGLAARLGSDDDTSSQVVSSADEVFKRLANGDADAAFVYAVEAATHHLPTIPLPAQLNLGDVRFANEYARVSIRVGDRDHRGAPIEYGCSVLKNAQNPIDAAGFLNYVIAGNGRQGFEKSGLTYIRRTIHGNRSDVPTYLL